MIAKLIAAPLLACLLIDPARVLAQVLLLSRLRARFPEMFDGAAAAESIRLALADAA